MSALDEDGGAHEPPPTRVPIGTEHVLLQDPFTQAVALLRRNLIPHHRYKPMSDTWLHVDAHLRLIKAIDGDWHRALSNAVNFLRTSNEDTAPPPPVLANLRDHGAFYQHMSVHVQSGTHAGQPYRDAFPGGYAVIAVQFFFDIGHVEATNLLTRLMYCRVVSPVVATPKAAAASSADGMADADAACFDPSLPYTLPKDPPIVPHNRAADELLGTVMVLETPVEPDDTAGAITILDANLYCSNDAFSPQQLAGFMTLLTMGTMVQKLGRGKAEFSCPAIIRFHNVTIAIRQISSKNFTIPTLKAKHYDPQQVYLCVGFDAHERETRIQSIMSQVVESIEFSWGSIDAIIERCATREEYRHVMRSIGCHATHHVTAITAQKSPFPLLPFVQHLSKGAESLANAVLSMCHVRCTPFDCLGSFVAFHSASVVSSIEHPGTMMAALSLLHRLRSNPICVPAAGDDGEERPHTFAFSASPVWLSPTQLHALSWTHGKSPLKYVYGQTGTLVFLPVGQVTLGVLFVGEVSADFTVEGSSPNATAMLRSPRVSEVKEALSHLAHDVVDELRTLGTVLCGNRAQEAGLLSVAETTDDPHADSMDRAASGSSIGGSGSPGVKGGPPLGTPPGPAAAPDTQSLVLYAPFESSAQVFTTGSRLDPAFMTDVAVAAQLLAKKVHPSVQRTSRVVLSRGLVHGFTSSSVLFSRQVGATQMYYSLVSDRPSGATEKGDKGDKTSSAAAQGAGHAHSISRAEACAEEYVREKVGGAIL